MGAAISSVFTLYIAPFLSMPWSRADDLLKLDCGVDEGGKVFTKPFSFVAMADTQFGFMSDNAEWAKEMELAELAVEFVNMVRPRFAIMCGDLVHHVPELYPNTDPHIRDQQVADFQGVFVKVSADIPLLCVCGNHDVLNRPTPLSIERYKNDFGSDYYTFWCEGSFFIVLNSNLYNDPSDALALFEQQHLWLENQLQLAKDQGALHIVLFTHHPLFLRYAREPDEDERLFGVTSWLESSSGMLCTLQNSYFHIPLERRLPLLNLLKQYGCHWVFSGHYHRCLEAYSADFDVHQVVTSAVGKQLGSERSGFSIVNVDENYYPSLP